VSEPAHKYTRGVAPADLNTDESRISVADGLRPQQLLVTLLGDYWLSATDPVPSGALVEVLADFGVSSTNARAALSRVARRGILDQVKTGRATAYSLTADARQTLGHGLDRIMRFGRPPAAWHGEWTWVAFSIPESQRAIRQQLRGRLRWYGFAPLYDALWVSPRQLTNEARAILVQTRVDSATVMVGRDVGNGGRYGNALDAWDLGAIRAEYESVMRSLQEESVPAGESELALKEALVARTRVMDRWRQLPAIDPELPTELLPEAWPRDGAYELFHRVHDALGPLAVDRIRSIVAAHPGGRADEVRLPQTP
jgi:phenylacetic acid degradation operon negative regulatory protein